MIQQSFGPRRCKDSRKPFWTDCPDVQFYQCKSCGALYPVTTFGDSGTREITCCGEKLEALVPVKYEDGVLGDIKLDYQITGGFNDNAVRVKWSDKTWKWKPDWIYLKTFVGGYLKYITDSKRSPLVFALADTDAFCYCDKDPCLECTFRCKRGFVIYFYGKDIGLVEIPLDKFDPYWQVNAKK